MPLSRDEFVNRFSAKVLNDRVSLFLGAGATMDAGYPSWANLFAPCAEALSIDSDIENFYQLAQFYANSFGASELRQLINRRINRTDCDSRLVDQLIDIGFSNIWTTNFDNVVEMNYLKRGININKVFADQDLANVNINGRLNLFKMNGDITNLDGIIATKDDYENYATQHELLTLFLKRELVANTFLFVGYSFTDNLVLNCLSSLRSCLGNALGCHYAIMPSRKGDRAFELFVEDLELRYNIKVLLVERNDIPGILKEVNRSIRNKKVFLSGSIGEESDAIAVEADAVAANLASSLLDHNYRIHTCIGKRFGTYLAGHAYRELSASNALDIDRRLVMKPFPFHGDTSSEMREQHRRNVIGECSAAVFAYGRFRPGYPDVACGVYEEYQIARDLGLVIIPLGSTGMGALSVWKDVKRNITRYPYLEKYIDLLNSERDPHRLANLTMGILDEALA